VGSEFGGQWKKSPKFLLRERCVRWVTRKWSKGRFVEFGAGTGTMTKLFLERGFRGVCSDISALNCSRLRENLSAYGSAVSVIQGIPERDGDPADYLFAFEVLEHIPDDRAALESWIPALRPGGRVLLSVPAHQRKFGRVDSVKGHVRRYERAQLEGLLREVGFRDVEVFCYGFPLGNLTRLAQQAIDRFRPAGPDLEELSPEERSVLSGRHSVDVARRPSWLVNRLTLAPFLALQLLFLRSELGDGYVATGILGRAS
jgi:SAM-dependent methyltransferase